MLLRKLGSNGAKRTSTCYLQLVKPHRKFLLWFIDQNYFFNPTNCTGSNALFRSLVYCLTGRAVNHISWNLKIGHCFTPKPAFCMLSRHRKMLPTPSNITPLKSILLLPSYLSFGFPTCVFNLDKKFYIYGLRQKIRLPDDTPNGRILSKAVDYL